MTVSTKGLTWMKEKRTWVAEISDFGPGFRFEQIYVDACDIGLTLLSHNTGREATFYVADTCYKGEDLAYWLLLPTSETSRKIPGLKGTKFYIYND